MMIKQESFNTGSKIPSSLNS